MQPMEQQRDSDLIREIYRLTHDVQEKPELQVRLDELKLEAEKRKLM